MRIQRFSSLSDAFVDAWQSLYKMQERHNPLADWRFIRNAIEICEQNHIAFLLGHQNGAVVMAAVLFADRASRVSSLDVSQFPYTSILVSEQFDLRSWSQVIRSFGLKKMVLELYHIDVKYLKLCVDPVSARCVPYGITMSIEVPTWSANVYWSGASRKLVGNLRRYGRRAVEEFELTFTHTCNSDAIGEKVNNYGLLESAGWKAGAGTAIHPDNAQGRFYSSLLQDFASSGQAHVFELYFDGALVASRLALSAGSTIVFLKTTYDENFKKFAPGRLLLERVINHCLESKIANQFEFYTKATPDQLQWATDSRETRHYNLFRNSCIAGMDNVIQWLREL